MLISKFPAIGSLTKPLCGLVLHFGEGGSGSLPNETAWLSKSISSHVTGPPVRVYVSRSSLQTMRTVYACLGKNVIVEPLFFQNIELDTAAILSMMAVGSSESAPLYMQIILVRHMFLPFHSLTVFFQSILRELGENFTYSNFMKQLEVSKQKFNPAQLAGLEQRLSLLNSFLEPSQDHKKKPSTNLTRFSAGQLTIIDLSDPFLDAASACGLFEIIVRLFIRADVDTGKVLVVDEAHKVSVYVLFFIWANLTYSIRQVFIWFKWANKITIESYPAAETSRYESHYQYPRQALYPSLPTFFNLIS